MAAANNVVPGWFSIEGAAAYTGFSSRSIRSAIKHRLFPYQSVSVTPGSRQQQTRIRREDLDAWIEGRSSAPAADG